ncbi:hypothetical protein ATCC90586_003375 [Pythium insidiosum]|nr:hypothetical protein ATCC90586_003375 [Pythium insidiosum]
MDTSKSLVVPISSPMIRKPSRLDSFLSLSRLGGLALLSGRLDRALSLAIVALHVLAMTFAASVARLHWLLDREPVLRLNMSFLGVSTLTFLRPVMVVMAALTIAHGALLLRLACRRRLATLATPAKSNVDPPAKTQLAEPNLPLAHSAWRILTQPWQRLGLDLADLDLLVELAFQTYQATKLSRLVATIWINRLIAFVILANCWFSPVVHALWRRRPVLLRQLMCGVCDSLLDVLYFMVIPFAIFVPYLRSILPTYYFPFTVYYEDEWFVNAVAENQQVFVTSWLDFVSKMLPGVTLVLRLYRVRHLLDDYRALSRRASSRPLPAEERRHLVQTTMSRGKRIVQIILLIWGGCVLGLHIHATSVAVQGAERGCILEMRPWASTVYTCSVLEISCSQRGMVGAREEIASVFDRIDVERIYSLILSNCPALAIPPRLQALPALVMIKIYNSTIASWDHDAALTASTHPALQVLYLIDTSLPAGIPPGMRSPDPPPALYDVEITGSDLDTLPDDLEFAWRNLLYLFVERSPRLSVLPPVLGRLPAVDYLVLAYNNLTEIPDTALTNLSLRLFYPTDQPLQRLPANVGRLMRLEEVGVEGTDVATLPASWLLRDTMPGYNAADASGAPPSTIALYAYGTPLCRGPLLSELIANGSAEIGVEPNVTMVGWFRVICTMRPRFAYNMYPLQEEREWRLRNRN